MYICVCGHISTHTCMYTEKVCIYMLYLVEKGRVCVCVRACIQIYAPFYEDFELD